MQGVSSVSLCRALSIRNARLAISRVMDNALRIGLTVLLKQESECI